MRQMSFCFAINLNNDWGEAHFAEPEQVSRPISLQLILGVQMFENSRRNPTAQRVLR
jgi:hypothetical protein